MKKDEFVNLVKSENWTEETDPETILNFFIEQGFRLPQKQCKMIYDDNGQPLKHGPVEYGFDEE